jgi:UDP-N-acetylmuramoylalanine--D-glutamate ligase
LFKYQENNDYAIYSLDNEELKEKVSKINCNQNVIKILSTKNIDEVENNTIYCDEEKIYYKNNNRIKELYNVSDKRNLLGRHNVENIMFALAVSEILNLNLKKTIKSINTFKPLPHRMEYVGKYKDILFYNDSIATIPSATINCIETLKEVNSLIVGGMDRGIDYSELIEYLKNSTIENIICLKDTGYKIGEKLKNIKKIFYAENMEDAVKYAYKHTVKEKICLLSPAASSYNFYKNFEEKGNEYKKIIEYLSN